MQRPSIRPQSRPEVTPATRTASELRPARQIVVHNADVAAIFNEIADLLEIQAANPFRVRAYRTAARNIEGLSQSVQLMVQAGTDLDALPGIGKDLAAKIAEIIATGTCGLLERLRRELPPAIVNLLRVPGLGPKRVLALHLDLGVQSLEQLYKAAQDGRIRSVPGFGEKTEQRILQAVQAQIHAGKDVRYKLAHAAQIAEPLVNYLKATQGASQVIVAGSFRRMRETVGDLDVLMTTTAPNDAVARFVNYDDVREVIARGVTRASVRLLSGMQVDLRVVAPASFGAALQYFTGSKAHNIAIRRLGQERGLKINEYGVFRGNQRVAGNTEESVYRAVDLPFIAPELREDRGEIDAARTGRLPKLVELADLKGDLHAHTRATDGQNTLREMALAAQNHGLSYLAITEHSQRLKMTHGLDAARLSQQIDEIDALNPTLKDFVVLKGIEVDILEDGTLDLPDSILSRLDIVVAAVHSKFDLSRAQQTERILRAMERPYFTMLAHPTGRMLFEREPYDVDMQRIVKHAKQRGCFLELNAHPQRLDLLDTDCQMAKSEGVLVSINSDAHSAFEFDNLRFGVGQARRGWLEASDVLNTRTLSQLRDLLARK
jgi:DNA polymerase (family X)